MQAPRIATSWFRPCWRPSRVQRRCTAKVPSHVYRRFLNHRSFSPKRNSFRNAGTVLGISAGGLGVLGWTLLYGTIVHAESSSDLPPRGNILRLSEVRKHGAGAERIWVIKDTSIYDITDWISVHPGGDVILRSAGGSINPFWKIFSIHQKQDVYDILEQYLIGTLDPRDLVDGEVPQNEIEDPFSTDPVRSPLLHIHTDRPCNAETPASELSTFITPNALFYVRNHLWVPPESLENPTHTLTVELTDGTEKTYTMSDLRSKFPPITITATLQCSGNRRKHMSLASRSTNGLQWSVGAIGTATWTGVLLRDVLADAGLPLHLPLPPDIKHAQFLGSEAYGASIPISKAVSPAGDVLLAYAMNGVPLPPDHGYPLRVIVPGHVAARSVKWVSRISLSDEESTSQWQRRDYKCFGPNEGSSPDWDKARSIQEMPVQSAITGIREVSNSPPWSAADRKLVEVYGLEEDSVELEGYALSGGGREIVRVDISLDDGGTWRQAEILNDNSNSIRGNGINEAEEAADEEQESQQGKHWAWQRWRCIVAKRDVGAGYLVKAVDEAYNSQPETHGPTYNFRGNLATAWHRIPRGEKS